MSRADHAVLNRPIEPPFPSGMKTVLFGMGCFWGAEKQFWALDGVHATAVGYAGGNVAEPSYEQVCTGRTDHAEVVLVVYDPQAINFTQLLRVFWEGHDPTQGMRQGNDVGSQYRSVVFTSDAEQRALAESTRDEYQKRLAARGYGPITTEIRDAPPFYYAEEYHQQYLAKNPAGYCGLGGTGVRFDAADPRRSATRG